MNLTLALSLLLMLGFGLAQVARLAKLPSVTGYIVAGIVIGPVGLNLIPHELLGVQLRVFTNIALLLVAFGIGERFDLSQLTSTGRAVARVSLSETAATYLLVVVAVGVAAWLTGAGGAASGPAVWVATALVAASIAVATAPASMVAVIRELAATGPVSRLLLSSVVVNNALSITLFGLAAAAAKALLGTATTPLAAQVLRPVLSTLASLALGVGVGLLIDLVVHRLSRRHDVLIVSLAGVFLAGGLSVCLGLSSLLTGVAAGFALVNRDRRDVRAFRALNDFEPPLYGLFFALAGVELHLQQMLASGVLGLVFVLARAGGKCVGAWLGARQAGLEERHARMLGLGLLPQAGLAIGLAFLVRQDDALLPIRDLVISLTVASVVVNELIGPPLVRWLLQRTGEVAAPVQPLSEAAAAHTAASVIPWTWPKLKAPHRPDGYVIAALGNPTTTAGTVRMAALLAHYYGARLMALHVQPPPDPVVEFWPEDQPRSVTELFSLAAREADSLGYPLDTEIEFAESVAAGIVHTVEEFSVQAVVLGHPLRSRGPLFGQIVDAVAHEVLCPVIVVKQSGPLHTERILVPMASPEDFGAVRGLVCALAQIMEHHITVLRLMPPETGEAELEASVSDLRDWPVCQGLPGTVEYLALKSENRVADILRVAEEHDVVVMTTGGRAGLRRLFFGSLAEDVASRLRKPILILRSGAENASLPAQD